jgi:hypothetical protein
MTENAYHAPMDSTRAPADKTDKLGHTVLEDSLCPGISAIRTPGNIQAARPQLVNVPAICEDEGDEVSGSTVIQSR